MAERTLSVKILGDSQSAERALKNVEGATKRLDPASKVANNAIGNLSSSLSSRLGPAGDVVAAKIDKMGASSVATGGLMKSALVGGAAAGALALGNFFQGAVSEADEARRAMAQTEAAIRSTGGAANVTGEDVSKLAEKLSLVAGVDDELIQQGQNVLLTFTQVRNEVGEGNRVFDRATAAALDLSARMGGDLQGAIVQVGKALNDPIKGLAGLAKAGIQFTEQQKEQIKVLVASGDMLGAQKIILKELETQFGGSAAANATATDRMKVAVGNLQESVGEGLIPVVDDGADALASLTSTVDDATQAIGGLEGTIGKISKFTGAANPLNIFKGASKAIKGDFGGALESVGGPLTLIGDKADDTGKKTDKLAGASHRAAGGQDALAGATGRAGDAAGAAADEEERQVEAIDKVLNASIKAVNAQLGLERATASERKAVDEYNVALAANAAAKGLNAEAAAKLKTETLSAKDAMVAQAEAGVRLAESEAQARGETFAAADGARVFKENLLVLAGTVQGPLREQLLALAGHIQSVEGAHNIVVNADTTEARNQLAALARELHVSVEAAQRYRDFFQRPVAPRAAANPAEGVTFYAKGGYARARPGGVLARIAEGGADEAVISAADPEGGARLFNQLYRSKVPSFASGGLIRGARGSSGSSSWPGMRAEDMAAAVETAMRSALVPVLEALERARHMFVNGRRVSEELARTGPAAARTYQASQW